MSNAATPSPGHPAKPKVTNRVIRLSSAAPEVSGPVIAQIMEIERQVFTDKAPEKTQAALLGQYDDEVWVMVMESAGKVVGYSSIRISHYLFEGKRVACWKSRAGVLPEFRGHNKTAQFPAILYWRYRLRHPLRKIYGLIGLAHPSSFKLFSEAMPRMYPFPKTQLSAREKALQHALCEQGGYTNVPGHAFFVVQAASHTNTSELETKYWRNSNNPAVVFFLAQNPLYAEGKALLSFFPIDLSLMWGMGQKKLALGARLRRFWLGISPGARLRARAELLDRLLGSQPLPASTRDKVARLIREVRPQPGHNLIVHGEAQPSIYFLAQGSLLVHLPTPRGPITVDQLAPGAIVGEIGALLGVPATATVQAMGRCSLLQLGPEAIALLRAEAPALMAQLHQLMESRLAMNNQLTNEGHAAP